MAALDFLRSRPVILGIRIAQLVLSIIVLGLTAYGMPSLPTLNNEPSRPFASH